MDYFNIRFPQKDKHMAINSITLKHPRLTEYYIKNTNYPKDDFIGVHSLLVSQLHPSLDISLY